MRSRALSDDEMVPDPVPRRRWTLAQRSAQGENMRAGRVWLTGRAFVAAPTFTLEELAAALAGFLPPSNDPPLLRGTPFSEALLP